MNFASISRKFVLLLTRLSNKRQRAPARQSQIKGGKAPVLHEEYHCQRQGRRGRLIWQSRSKLFVSYLTSGLITLLFFSERSKLFGDSCSFDGLPNLSTRSQICSSNWVVTADFLAWFPSEEVASIWADVITIGNNTSSWGAPGFNLKWSYGFRIGTGYNFIYDQWDTNLYWTWFRSDAQHTIPSSPQTSIHPEFFAAFLSGNVPQSIRAKWNLLFNMADWELGRSYWISKHLSLRPFLGIKGGSIHQEIFADYFNLTIQNVLTSITGKEHLKNNFWGIGPLGGIQTKWRVKDFGSHFFDLFGDFSMATLWGTWTNTDVYKTTLPYTSSVNTKNTSLGAWMLRGFMGIGWEVDFNKNRSHFSTKVGYEMQFWANQLRIATFQLQRLHNDLTLQGFTLNCRCDF